MSKTKTKTKTKTYTISYAIPEQHGHMLVVAETPEKAADAFEKESLNKLFNLAQGDCPVIEAMTEYDCPTLDALEDNTPSRKVAIDEEVYASLEVAIKRGEGTTA
jgi:hypothetical protein